MGLVEDRFGGLATGPSIESDGHLRGSPSFSFFFCQMHCTYEVRCTSILRGTGIFNHSFVV